MASSFSLEAMMGLKFSFDDGPEADSEEQGSHEMSAISSHEVVDDSKSSQPLLSDKELPSRQEAADAASQFSSLLFFKQPGYAEQYLKYQRARSPWILFVVVYLYLSWLLCSLYSSWLIYHYSPWAVVAAVGILCTSLVPGMLMVIAPLIINLVSNSNFEHFVQLQVLPRLETVWLMATLTFYASGLMLKVSMGKCPDSNNFMEVLACDTEVQQHKLGEDYALLICIMPALLSMVLKGVDWVCILVAWTYSVAMVLCTIQFFGMYLSLSAVLVAFPVPVLILYENRRQSILMFILEQKHRKVLIENNQMAEEIQANELRHMIGNVAHDLKTPLSGFMSGLELISSVVKDLEKYFIHDFEGAIELTEEDREFVVQSLTSISSSTRNVRSVHTFMLMTINRCLDYTKASRGLKLVPHLQTVDVREVISLPMFCMQEMQSRIKLTQDPLPSNMCPFLITDLQWLQENILCLLSNAVKYSDKGVVTLRVSLLSGGPRSSPNKSKEQKLNFKQSYSVGDGTLNLLSETVTPMAHKGSEAVKQKTNNGYTELVNMEEGVSGKQSSHGHAKQALDVKTVMVEVEDMGIGMTDEARAALFNPFKQAQRMAGGTGLGLFSLARRVEALNGKYGVRARDDGEQGSVFWFTLPYRPDHEHEKAAIAEVGGACTDLLLWSPVNARWKKNAEEFVETKDPPMPRTISCSRMNMKSNNSFALNSTSGDEAKHRSLNILLVDDSLSIQKMSSMLLKRAGHAVIVADNGADALEVLKENIKQREMFDVILMDIHMPVMDGFESTRRLREIEKASGTEGPTTPVMVFGVSANSDFETKTTGLEVGMTDFIPKPLTMDAFHATFERNAKTAGLPGLFVSRAERAKPPLPLLKVPSPSKPSNTSTGAQTSSAPSSVKSTPTNGSDLLPAMKVLIVDDSMAIQKMSGMMLKRKGHTVSCVGDGDEGVDTIMQSWNEKEPYDAILMDCQMPRLSGWDATAIIRKNEAESGQSHHHIIIGMSASSDSEVIAEGYQAGLDKFLAKPFSYDAFVRAYNEIHSKASAGAGSAEPSSVECVRSW